MRSITARDLLKHLSEAAEASGQRQEREFLRRSLLVALLPRCIRTDNDRHRYDTPQMALGRAMGYVEAALAAEFPAPPAKPTDETPAEPLTPCPDCGADRGCNCDDGHYPADVGPDDLADGGPDGEPMTGEVESTREAAVSDEDVAAALGVPVAPWHPSSQVQIVAASVHAIHRDHVHRLLSHTPPTRLAEMAEWLIGERPDLESAVHTAYVDLVRNEDLARQKTDPRD
jgi:hypothetical protein